MRHALLLVAALTLGACKPSAPTVLQQEANAAEATKALKGWDRAFGVPDAAVGAANQFGFQAGAYTAADGGFGTSGKQILMSNSNAKTPNRASFAATGAHAGRIDKLAFTLALTDDGDTDTAKTRFSAVVRDFLSQFDIGNADALAKAIADESAMQGNMSGAVAGVSVEPDGNARKITVTFTRPDASGQAS
jgi:hypothetical protein